MPFSDARLALGALSLAAALPAAAAAQADLHPAPAAESAAARAEPPVVGVVRDTAGAPLPNVQVVVAGLNRVATTDDQGRFEFRGLPAGRYHLDAILIGYARADTDLVVPAADLEARTMELANRIAEKSPVALRMAKEAVKTAARANLDEGLRREIDLFALTFSSQDKDEGVRAFLEKRKPDFKGV